MATWRNSIVKTSEASCKTLIPVVLSTHSHQDRTTGLIDSTVVRYGECAGNHPCRCHPLSTRRTSASTRVRPACVEDKLVALFCNQQIAIINTISKASWHNESNGVAAVTLLVASPFVQGTKAKNLSVRCTNTYVMTVTHENRASRTFSSTLVASRLAYTFL